MFHFATSTIRRYKTTNINLNFRRDGANGGGECRLNLGEATTGEISHTEVKFAQILDLFGAIYLNVITRSFKSRRFKYITRIAVVGTHFVSHGRWRPIRLSDSIPIRQISPVNEWTCNGERKIKQRSIKLVTRVSPR